MSRYANLPPRLFRLQTRAEHHANNPLAIIETSYPLFVIHTNHVTTLPDTPIYTLCEQIYAAALTHLCLAPHAHLFPLRAILSATFDSSHRAFVQDATPDTQRILAALDADARACVFAQAIAGVVAVLRAAAECRSPLTPERAAAKLRRFEEDPRRAAMLQAIETSPVWSDCFEKAQIGEMILRAACGEESAAVAAVSLSVVDVSKKDATTVDIVEIGADVVSDPVFNDGPHLERSFGVPGVFSIMALN